MIPWLSLRSNHGLQLANAFGVDGFGQPVNASGVDSSRYSVNASLRKKPAKRFSTEVVM